MAHALTSPRWRAERTEVPFVSLDREYRAMREELIAAFDRVGRSGVYILGEELARFEREAAAYCEVPYALGVGNGSDALLLALKALDIGPGDEVITCPNSFIATAWVIVAAGAHPVFVDVGTDGNMNPELLSQALTARTRAIIPVHLTGRPAEMNAINAFARAHRLDVIEDAAQAIGARYHGKRVGSLGRIAGFSLHPLKNLGVMGDGGLITTNDAELFEKLKLLRNHGLRTRDECAVWGINSRLDPLQAALAAVKLRRLDAWNARYRDIAARYRQSLSEYVEVPVDQVHEEAVYHNFVIQLDRRDELLRHLEGCGVGCRVHYPVPIHLQACARDLGYCEGAFPVTERLARRMLSLPIYPELNDGEIEHVIASVQEFFK
jgi:dTDP-4-amino-4,6-dideoxygalactose transaminase